MNPTLRASGVVPVLTFLTNFLIGGTERQVLNLVRSHDRRRFDVHLGCFGLRGPLLSEVDTNTVALSEYPISTLPSRRTIRQQWSLARYLAQHGVRVMHSFGFYANVFAIPAARLAGVDVVIASIRDTGDHLTSWQRRLQKWVCRAADHILVNATAVKRVLERQGYDPSRISVIENGIDMRQLQSRNSGASVREEFGFSGRAPVIAVFARLNRLKGVEYFLHAAAAVARRRDDVRFLIVGDSISQEYRDELERLARALGLGDRVVFAGFRSDVPRLLAAVTISVLPSLSEGLSNVVLESMAAGLPVIATAVGGTPEMIEDGRTGLLVPPGNASAIASAICSLLEDPARSASLGEAARRSVADRFSLEATVRRTEDLYERLLLAAEGRAARRFFSLGALAGSVSRAPEPRTNTLTARTIGEGRR